MLFFVLFLVTLVVFVIVEYEISHFFTVIQLIVDNHPKSPITRCLGFRRVFAWQPFLVAVYLYFIQINHNHVFPRWLARNETIFDHAAHMSVVRARLNISKSHLFIDLDSFRRELQSFRGFFEEELRA